MGTMVGFTLFILVPLTGLAAWVKFCWQSKWYIGLVGGVILFPLGIILGWIAINKGYVVL